MEKKLTGEPSPVAQPPADSTPQDREVRVNGKPSGVRYASDENFRKAHKKTTRQHAELFRRLAE